MLKLVVNYFRVVDFEKPKICLIAGRFMLLEIIESLDYLHKRFANDLASFHKDSLFIILDCYWPSLLLRF